MCAAKPTPKRVVVGTHRSSTIEGTLERVHPYLAAWGITRVANVTGLDDIGIPTAIACRPSSRSLSVTQGKGLTHLAAKVSAIMEAAEHFHAERIELSLNLASYRDLRARRDVIDIGALPRYARPFDDGARILWVQGRELASNAPVLVPYELVHLDLRLPLPGGSGFFHIGSNGLASGNALSEALAHGVWELFERDALALFYARSPEDQARRRVRLSSIDDESCRSLLDRFSAAGVGVAIWDMTTDLEVPAFLCSIIEREIDPFRPVGLARGYGCHLDRGVALARALCEAAQSRLTRITGSRDDFQEPEVSRIRSVDNIARHQAVLREEEYAEHDFRRIPSHSFESFEQDLEFARHKLERCGLGPIVYVDLSRTEYPISVVRVIVPGLEGSPEVAGYVPGRRASGLREQLTAEGSCACRR